MPKLMPKLLKTRTLLRAARPGTGARVLCLFLGTLWLAACGGGSGSGGAQPSAPLSGNWQFTVAPPADHSFSGGLQGGFLLQKNGSVSGAAEYSVSTPSLGPCNSGSAPISGTLSGQTVSLTAVAGTQSFSLTGTLSSDGSTMSGTYSSTDGVTANGASCGTAQAGLAWTATLVPTITGAIQGSFHSTGGTSGLGNQDFIVSGSLVQGQNIGAPSATVSGTLSFIQGIGNLSDYPCFATASVNGEISGNSVILQIIGDDGSLAGQIGGPADSSGTTGINPVTFDSVQGGNVLHGAGPSYLVATKACPGTVGSIVTAGDYGNICLALGSTSACQQPILLSPSLLVFPGQLLGTAPTTESITLTNNTSSTLSGLTLNFQNIGDNQFSGQSDFNGLPSYSETDTCASAQGASFALGGGQTCSIQITFSPQEACPWLPFPAPPSIFGAAPEWCPFAQGAEVTVNSSSSADGDKAFAVPITGLGISAVQPSTPELDFGAEAISESSPAQTVSFTNISTNPVQILATAPCTNVGNNPNTLPSPRRSDSPVAGLQVVDNNDYQITPDADAQPASIRYRCDSDPGTQLPNFQLSSDTCSGALLVPQGTCSVQVTFQPQPNTNISSGFDYFLELNTVQCYGAVTSDCEIDSGRFPVEIKANKPSPLRMLPAAGLDFGLQFVGQPSLPLTITLLNDPSLPNPQPVQFVGRFQVQGNYSELDDCPVTLSPGSSCTLTITFTPGTVAFLPGAITINYSPEPTGQPQIIYLRGTGQ
jgi:hypothetical protein